MKIVIGKQDVNTSTLNKQEIVDMLIAYNEKHTDDEITFDPKATKAELISLLENRFGDKEVKEIDLDKDSKPMSEKELKKRSKMIISKATEINDKYSSLKTDEERKNFLDGVGKGIGLDDAPEHVKTLFANVFSPAPIPQASDLPLSQIITNIPVRVVEQRVYEKLVSYPLMQKLGITPEQVRNGMKQIFYPDYRDADDKSGYSDVEIGDYNMGTEPIFSELYNTDTNIHKGYDIISSMLNDITLSMGLFIALVDDFGRAIAHPIAKQLYTRFIDFLGADASYDKLITFTNQDNTKTKATKVYEELTSLQTPSRNNLVVKPNGSSKALEHALDPSQTSIILNHAYASNYKYDLSAGTFQLGEIKLDVKQIIIQDFAKLEEYATNAGASTLDKREVIFYEDGVYFELQHFSGRKVVDTPKLKMVSHQFMRVGNGRRKDKILIGFQRP